MFSWRDAQIFFWVFIGCTIGGAISKLTTERVMEHFYPGHAERRCAPARPAATPAAGSEPDKAPALQQEVAHA